MLPRPCTSCWASTLCKNWEFQIPPSCPMKTVLGTSSWQLGHRQLGPWQLGPWHSGRTVGRHGRTIRTSSSSSQFQISSDLRWVDVISRAGHWTGEHEGGDSLQLPEFIIIMMMTMTALVKLYDIGDVHDDHDDQNCDDKIELKNMSVEIRSDFLRLWLEWWHSYDDNLINRRKCDCLDRDDQSVNRIIG